MDLAEKKEMLLHIVDDADERLAGLLIALAEEYKSSLRFSEDEINYFYQRRKEFIESGKKGSSVEEVHGRIRSNYRNGL